jgi:hypothetical protein
MTGATVLLHDCRTLTPMRIGWFAVESAELEPVTVMEAIEIAPERKREILESTKKLVQDLALGETSELREHAQSLGGELVRARSELLRCPKCGERDVASIEMVPMAYSGNFAFDERGQIKFVYGGSSRIVSDDGTPEEYRCRSCDEVLELHGDEIRLDIDAALGEKGR